MPALDTLMAGGAVHMADQNKLKPIKTLCGQALDKESTKYFLSKDNFSGATCKVCRGIYFDEKWEGDNRPETPQEEDQALREEEAVKEEQPVRKPLFANLVPPINQHSNQEKNDGP